MHFNGGAMHFDGGTWIVMVKSQVLYLGHGFDCGIMSFNENYKV